MKRLAIACTALTVACVTACGGLPDHEGSASTLVTLHGSVQSQSGALAGPDVRVALIWESGDQHALAVDAPVKAEFPASFSLPVTSAPPSGFVVPTREMGGASVALGVLVAYKDENKNGKLDLLHKSSTKAIDRIVGMDESHILVFIQSAPNGFGKLKDPSGVVPHLGFNIIEHNKDLSTSKWVPMSTQLVLTEDSSSDAQAVMCVDGTSSSSGGVGKMAPPGTIGPGGAYPAPDDPNLSCDPSTPDEYSYTVDTTTVNRPCDKQYSSVTTVYSKQPGTSPAGWPCP